MIPSYIQDYIIKQIAVSVPQLQRQFNLNYADARDIISQLEKQGILTLREGITYEFVPRNDDALQNGSSTDNIQEHGMPYARAELIRMLNRNGPDGTPLLYINILRYIIQQGKVDIKDIQRRFATSMVLSNNIVRWCEEKGYISPLPEHKVILTKEGFDARYATNTDKPPEPENKSDLEKLLENFTTDDEDEDLLLFEDFDFGDDDDDDDDDDD